LPQRPADGRPLLLGGPYLVPGRSIRATRRDRNTLGIRDTQYGFRVARPM